MILKEYSKHLFFGIALFCLVSFPLGCGEDNSMYEGEALTFQNIKTEKEDQQVAAKEVAGLDLGADESSDFAFRRIGPYGLGYAPYTLPLYDYYTQPLAVEVPVSPVVSVVDWVHPFYAYRYFHAFINDDDGVFFYDDDDT